MRAFSFRCTIIIFSPGPGLNSGSPPKTPIPPAAWQTLLQPWWHFLFYFNIFAGGPYFLQQCCDHHAHISLCPISIFAEHDFFFLTFQHFQVLADDTFHFSTQDMFHGSDAKFINRSGFELVPDIAVTGKICISASN